MEKSKDEIYEKILKILELTKEDRNPTADEARQAMLAVQRLMIKHHIDMNEIHSYQAKNGTFTPTTDDQPIQEPKRRIPWWESSLASVIADNFRCTYYYHSDGIHPGQSLYLFGETEDVQIGRYIYKFAHKVVLDCVDEYIKLFCETYNCSKGNIPTARRAAMKNDFIQGFLYGLSDAYKEQVAKNSWGLMIIQDKIVAKIYDDRKLKPKKSSNGIKPKRADDRSSMGMGYIKGKKFVEESSSEKKSLESGK